MARMDPDRWRVLSGLLDVVLELPAAECATWVAVLRERDRALADELQALLEGFDALERDGFLTSERWCRQIPPLARAAARRAAQGLVGDEAGAAGGPADELPSRCIECRGGVSPRGRRRPS